MAARKPILIVHGGASKIRDDFVPGYLEGIQAAAQAGFKALMSNGSSLDAVEAAVNSMEDNPFFNAGYGGSLTSEKKVELDAGIMEGATLRAGAVGCVKTVKNPVSLARAVMEKTDHVLLVAEGAEKFAKSISFPEIDNASLISDVAVKKFEANQMFSDTLESNFSPSAQLHQREDRDTVGAVAIDAQGRLAAAISTGGLTAKLPGRVGDSPLIGCGMYVDDSVGGVCTTGNGEAITRVVLAYRIYSKMAQGKSAQMACDEGIQEMREKIQEDGSGGVIAISSSGEVAFSFNTYRMAWAIRTPEMIRYGIDPRQVIEKVAEIP